MLLGARSAKMVRATNICGDKQAECGFEMLHCYTLEEAHPPQHSNPQLKPIPPTLKRQASSRKIPISRDSLTLKAGMPQKIGSQALEVCEKLSCRFMTNLYLLDKA